MDKNSSLFFLFFNVIFMELEKLGYKRFKCKSCGNYFWSLEYRETCGDAPCDEYRFIDNPPTKKNYDLYELEKLFLKFFEKKGHKIIPRYPVVAKRWRDDVFLVGASIYNFQPWVTSGIVDPPANPLVVSQPSIRLNDIDNVGRTGRHFTCFTMGGHHAFNKEDKIIYWKNETIKYCYEFLQTLGISPKKITFIESWWEGGGNAGPCYEVCVDGVELATLVFIQFKTNGKLEDIPLKIVDTGYGLERFAWVSQGTPTAYDAVFPQFIDKLKDITGVSVDKRLLKENARIAGLMDIETESDLMKLRKKVANKLNISVDKLNNIIGPMENIYAIADHTRCLTFMLSDGVIPSNMGEGYLARLVLRRIIRLMDELNLNMPLKKIMEIQIDILSKHYPEIEKHYDHILNVVELEEKRYSKTISKGKKTVKRIINDLKRKNKNKIPLKTLIKLYDSKGVPPELVREICKKEGISVELPDNFYTLVAEQHEGKKTKEKGKKIDLDLPETKLLFYEKPKEKRFNAKIIGSYKNSVILDKTLFYPEGGGQPSDRGYLVVNGKKFYVKNVTKVNNIILHELDTDNVENLVGKNVEGIIDWERRVKLTRNHTATHILLASARKILGDHVWQAGAKKGIKASRLDISHYKRLSRDEIKKIEKLANEYVRKNIKVNVKWMDRQAAEKKYGFILYQGGVIPGSKIRVVEIPGVDVQACAGTHVEYTGDIGFIKINRTERIQDGVERLEFSVGDSAVDFVQHYEDLLLKSAQIFRVEPQILPKTCKRFFEEWKQFKNEIERLKEEIAKLKIKTIKSKIKKINDLKVVCEELDASMKELETIASEFIKDGIDFVLLGNKNKNLVIMVSKKSIEKGIKANEFMKKITEKFGGGGGGRENIARGAIKENIRNILEFVYKIIEKESK